MNEEPEESPEAIALLALLNHTAKSYRECNKCCALKPLDQFARDRGRYYLRCLDCRVAGRRVDDNKVVGEDPLGRKVKRKTERNLRQYGLTVGNYCEMLQKYPNCAICHKEFEGREPYVDHNHATGAVRGLLCACCNTMIGFARERPDTLRGAIDYLATFNN